MTRRRRLLLLALALLLLGGYGITAVAGAGWLSRARAYRAGTCVHRTGETVRPTSCADPDALRIAARVAARADCPPVTALAFTARHGNRFVLCLVPA
jgi:hypothetical protein